MLFDGTAETETYVAIDVLSDAAGVKYMFLVPSGAVTVCLRKTPVSKSLKKGPFCHFKPFNILPLPEEWIEDSYPVDG